MLLLKWLCDIAGDSATLRLYVDSFPTLCITLGKEEKRLQMEAATKQGFIDKITRTIRPGEGVPDKLVEATREHAQVAAALAHVSAKAALINAFGHSLGYDRHYRRYWCFSGAGGAFGAARLFVEDPDSHSLFCYDTAEVPVNVCVNVYICVLSNSSSIYCVRLCVHLQSLSQLIDAMNTRGVREKFLQKQLQDRVGEIIGQIQIRQQRDGQVCDHWNVCVCAVVCDHMCIPCSTWLLCLGMQASL